MDFSIGQVVYSKAGRDHGRPFIVLGVNDEFLYLADGRLRTAAKPKKKKIMHVQPTKTINAEIAEIVTLHRHLKDSDIRTALSEFWLKE